jgi:hypothetical protein
MRLRCLLLLLVVGLSLSSLSPLRAEGDSSVIYKGKLLSSANKPLEGIEVALVVPQAHIEGQEEETIPAKVVKTDKNGAWQISGPALTKLPITQVAPQTHSAETKTSKPAPIYSLLFVAFSPQHSLAWRRVQHDDKMPIVLKMAPHGSKRLVVRDSNGAPIAGAKMRLSWLYPRVWENDDDGQSSLQLPADLATRWAQSTGADGALKLSFVPPNTQGNFLIEAPGYATLGRNDYQDNDELVVTLPRPLTITVRLTAPPDSPLTIKGQKLSGYIRGAQQYDFYEVKPQTTDDKGEITLRDIGPGQAAFGLLEGKAAKTDYLAHIKGQFTIASGDDNRVVEIPLQAIRAYAVRGKVTSADGKPLKGVQIYGGGPGRDNDTYLAVTDAKGEYSFRAGEGQNRVSVMGAPEGYAVSRMYVPRPFKVEAGAALPIKAPDFILQKAASLKVLVLDAQGKPKPKARVSYATQEYFYDRNMRRTDSKGMLTISGAGGQIYLAARDGEAFSERKILKPPFPTLVTLRLKANGGAKLKGRVLDQNNRPLAGAKVQIIEQRERSSSAPTSVTTDAKGQWQSAALWPDAKFSIFVTAARHTPAKSADWQGEAGQTHDFGTLKLQHLGGIVAGTVRDQNGQPLSGARVWARGASSQGSKSETVSDSQGRFRLEGLPKTPLFLFAQKEGQPLGAAWQSAPRENLIVTMGRYNGSARPTRNQSEQDAAARRVTLRYLDKALTQIQTQKSDNATYQLSNLLSWLARLDTPRAIRLAAPHKDAHDRLSMTLGNLALKKSPPDITAALARWNSAKEPTTRAYSLVRALHDNAKTKPDLARPLIPAALTAARAVPEVSYRVIMLAKIGDVMNKLQPGSGDALLSEATTTVKQLGINDFEGYARAEVAECIVDKEPDQALALLEPIKDPGEIARYYGEVAYRLAARDPDRAIKLVRDNFTESYAEQRLAGLCHALATKDLPKAEALAATLKGQHKLNALRWMAEALAPTKPEEALRLWRAALDGSNTVDDDSPYGREQAGSQIMLLIARGREWGAPDVKQRALQAVANRPQREANYWDTDDYRVREEAQYALLLSLADPDLARDYAQVLSPVLTRKTKIESYIMEPMVLLTLVTDPLLTDQILRNAPAANLPSYVAAALSWVLGTPQERQKQIRRSVWMAEPFEDD